MEGLTEGRVVRYVLQPPEGMLPGVVLERVAIVTKVWNDTGLENLFVIGEGPYDHPSDPRLTGAAAGTPGPALFWATSVSFSEAPQPQTWHWPKKA